MSYVAATFPSNSKIDSFGRAKKFAARVGLEESDISAIRNGVYGCILPSDISDSVIREIAAAGGKVIPFVESHTAVVEEGKWIQLEKAVVGTRFEMAGTSPIRQDDGRILPDKFYVLGIQESEGGVFATLGRVDRLGDIGRKSGPGRYIYNVPLDSLREAVMVSSTEVASPVKSSDDTTGDTQTVATNESDRSMEILDMLLENDEFLARDRRKAQLKAGASVEAAKAEPNILSDMMEVAAGESATTYTEAELAPYKAVSGSSPTASLDGVDTLDEADADGILNLLLGRIDENHQDEPLEAAPAPVAPAAAPSPVAAVAAAPAETATGDDAGEDEELDEEMDPELFASIRSVVDAMVESGIDVDSLSDEELEEAVTDFLADLEEEDGEDASEGDDSSSASDDDAVADEDASADEATGTPDKQESTGGDFTDVGFEAAPSPDEVPQIKEAK